MRIDPAFPHGRVGVPTRRAEHTVYQILAHSDVPGRALYEARVLPKGRQIDFAIWLEGVGRFAAELKGGMWSIDDLGKWNVFAEGGWHRKDCPVTQAWDAAMSIPEAIQREFHRRVYIVGVLAFPDMEPDQIIVNAAARQRIEVIFGTDHWVERLAELAAPRGIIRPPTPGQIEQEVSLVMPELADPQTPDLVDPQTTQLATPGTQVVIQHVEALHLHVGPEGLRSLDSLKDAG